MRYLLGLFVYGMLGTAFCVVWSIVGYILAPRRDERLFLDWHRVERKRELRRLQGLSDEDY